jgi:acylphosphatase
MKSRKQTLIIKISGKVQGVGFRNWTKQVALRHNLKGTVMNCQDKTVEACITGNPNDIRMFLDIYKNGSKNSFIKKIDSKVIDYKEFVNFDIIYE